MPLNKLKLLDELKKFCIGDKNLPKSLEDASEKWSEALKKYSEDIFPQSINLELAKQSFKNLFLTMNFSGNGLIIFPNCFKAFQVSLSKGMIGYVSIPPVLPIDINLVKNLSNLGGINIETITLLTDLIDSNFKTGTATDSSLITINWI